MATTTIYNNALVLMAKGDMNFPATTETYKVLLLKPASTYTVDKSHVNVSQVINGTTGVEVDAGSGYETGGKTVGAITTDVQSGTNNIIITFPSVTWPSSTISTTQALIYKVGTSYSDAKLIAHVNFGSTITSSASTLTVSFSSPLKLAN